MLSSGVSISISIRKKTKKESEQVSTDQHSTVIGAMNR